MQKRGYFAVARRPLPAAVMVAWWCVEWWLSSYPFGILFLQDNSSLYSHKSVGWIKWVISHICTAAAASSKLCGPARQWDEGSAGPPPAPPPCHCGHCWWRRVTSHVRRGAVCLNNHNRNSTTTLYLLILLLNGCMSPHTWWWSWSGSFHVVFWFRIDMHHLHHWNYFLCSSSFFVCCFVR